MYIYIYIYIYILKKTKMTMKDYVFQRKNTCRILHVLCFFDSVLTLGRSSLAQLCRQTDS